MRLTWKFLKMKCFEQWKNRSQSFQALSQAWGASGRRVLGPGSRYSELSDALGCDKGSELCFMLLLHLCSLCSPNDSKFRNSVCYTSVLSNRHSLHIWLGRFLRKLCHDRHFCLTLLQSPLVSYPLLCLLVWELALVALNTDSALIRQGKGSRTPSYKQFTVISVIQ